jgi:hypothetical protein
VIVDSPRLNVTAGCEVWAANRSGGGYLWGYERHAALPDGLRLCSLSDPYRNLTATVIEETGALPAGLERRRAASASGPRAAGLDAIDALEAEYLS